MYLATALLSLAPISPASVADELRPGQDMRLYFEADAAAERAVTRLECTTDESGMLTIWVTPPGQRVHLAVHGALVVEATSTLASPCIELSIEAGTTVEVVVDAPAEVLAAVALRCHAALAAETEATRAAAELGGEQLEAVDASRKRTERVELLEQAIEQLRTTPGAERSRAVADVTLELGRRAFMQRRPDLALAAFELVVGVYDETLPRGHIEWLRAQNGLALSLRESGDLRRGHEVLLEVVTVARQVLPPDDALRIGYVENLAGSWMQLGELDLALEAAEEFHAAALASFGENDMRTRRASAGLMALRQARDRRPQIADELVTSVEQLLDTMPEDEPGRARTRTGLVAALSAAGRHEEARAQGEELVAELEQSVPPDDLDLLAARTNLAVALLDLGANEAALALQQETVRRFETVLSDDHPTLQTARQGLAISLERSGNAERAAELETEILRHLADQLPDDEARVLEARSNLAGTLFALGHLNEAARQTERILAVLERTRAEDDAVLARVRQNLALTRFEIGDHTSAIVLFERALPALEASIGEAGVELVQVRLNLASSLRAAGRHAEATRAAEAAMRAVDTLAEPQGLLGLRVRTRVANGYIDVGRYDDAAALIESTLASIAADVVPDHPVLLAARQSLAVVYLKRHELERALPLLEQLADGRRRRLPHGHPDVVTALAMLAWTQAGLGADDAAVALCIELADRLGPEIRRAAIASSPRELDARTAHAAKSVDLVLASAERVTDFEARTELERIGFRITETLRGAGLAAARLRRRAGSDAGGRELLDEQALAARDVAHIARTGDAPALVDAMRRREEVEARLFEYARDLDATVLERDVDPVALGAALRTDGVLIAYTLWSRPEGDEHVRHLLAHVVDPEGQLARVDLGPLTPVQAAVDTWRSAALPGLLPERGRAAAARTAAADVDVAGAELRALVLDPLATVLDGAVARAERLHVALAGPLHLVPLDALPTESGVVGDHQSVHVTATSWELLSSEKAGATGSSLILVGGLDYDSRPTAATVPLEHTSGAAFEALPGTAQEVAALVELHVLHSGGEAAVDILTAREATADTLLARTRGKRWIHLATHGFAELNSETGLSPLTHAGLALSGANLVDRVTGARLGLVTGEELSAYDLTACEIVVLSACETGVGSERASLGLASLQLAAHMAGARLAVTSLWRVPDEPTRELMVELWRGVWLENERPDDALWRAKAKLRAAGAPLHDWAGWVLTGDLD